MGEDRRPALIFSPAPLRLRRHQSKAHEKACLWPLEKLAIKRKIDGCEQRREQAASDLDVLLRSSAGQGEIDVGAKKLAGLEAELEALVGQFGDPAELGRLSGQKQILVNDYADRGREEEQYRLRLLRHMSKVLEDRVLFGARRDVERAEAELRHVESRQQPDPREIDEFARKAAFASDVLSELVGPALGAQDEIKQIHERRLRELE
jgi:hypothetical protein